LGVKCKTENHELPQRTSDRKRFRMDFMTIKQASEKWGICTRRVQTLCTEGRIKGAERLGYQWIIPIDAGEPKDARIKSGKYIKTRSGREENKDGEKTV